MSSMHELLDQNRVHPFPNRVLFVLRNASYVACVSTLYLLIATKSTGVQLRGGKVPSTKVSTFYVMLVHR